MGLTPKQQKFVNAYNGEAKGNATKAARLAGYRGGENAMAVTGHRLMETPKIRDQIKEFAEAHETIVDVHAKLKEAINGECADDLMGRILELRKVGVLDREGRQNILTEFALDDSASKNERMKAIELLCKMNGDFIERRQVDLTEHTIKEEQAKSQSFFETVPPSELKALLDKAYGDTDPDADDESAIN